MPRHCLDLGRKLGDQTSEADMHRNIVVPVALLVFLSALATPGFSQATKSTEWSPSTRAEDADFRYQLQWDPQNSTRVVVLFEIKNRLNTPWEGSARVADCATGTLGSDTKV